MALPDQLTISVELGLLGADLTSQLHRFVNQHNRQDVEQFELRRQAINTLLIGKILTDRSADILRDKLLKQIMQKFNLRKP